MSAEAMPQAMDRAREALPQFRQQDDWLLSPGASLMSDDSHEIIHVDTLQKIVSAVLAAQAEQPKAEPTTEAVQLARKILRNLGFALEPSSEPGADERVDRIAALIAATPAPAVPDDTARLNWLEAREASLITHREAIDDDEFFVWWTVADKIKKCDASSISGHPLGSVRAAIDAAMLAAAPEPKS